MKDSYLDLNVDVVHASNKNRHANQNDSKVVNSGPTALFSAFNIRTGSGNKLEQFNNADIACLLYIIISSTKSADDLSIGFDRGPGRRHQELTKNKTVKLKDHARLMLRHVFGLAE